MGNKFGARPLANILGLLAKCLETSSVLSQRETVEHFRPRVVSLMSSSSFMKRLEALELP